MPKTNKNSEGLLDSWGRKNRKIEDKNCLNCGKVFRPYNSIVKTCSKECGYAIRADGSKKLRKIESWHTNKKGYKMNITEEEKQRRSEHMKKVRKSNN